MYSILLFFPLLSYIVLFFDAFHDGHALYQHSCAFSWFFFCTKNDAYNPAYSHFFLCFLVLRNCYQPTCIFFHFSSTKICNAAVWRKGRKKNHDTYQIEDWMKVWSSIVCEIEHLKENEVFFALVHMLLAAEKRYNDVSLIRLLLLHLDWALL